VGLGGGLLMAAPLSRLISESPDGAPAGLANPFASWTSFGREDVLLLGTDVGGGNTDVIAAVRLDGGVTRVIQVPRDSYIETEAYGPIKINALQSLGGTDAVKQELSQRLGRPIGHLDAIEAAGEFAEDDVPVPRLARGAADEPQP
jgi:hypothetical protein